MFRILASALLWWAVCAVLPATSQAETNSARHVALVIGNSAYRNTDALANPRYDAEAISAALTRLGFEVVIALDVTQSQMADPVRKFVGRLREADVALLFYAGHGLSFEGDNYIVPVDASAKDAMDIRFGMHKIRTITDEMARWARLNIVMLDACRDNPLVRGINRSLGETNSSPLIGGGLSRIEQVGRQSYILLATKDGETAADGAGRHSPFTQALLNNIEIEGLEIDDLARRVRKEVRDATGSRQIPLIVGSREDAFYFKPRTAGDTSSPAVTETGARDKADERRRDQLFWESVKDLNSIELFRSYIERFPNGEYVPVAEAKIKQLKQASETLQNKDKAPPPAPLSIWPIRLIAMQSATVRRRSCASLLMRFRTIRKLPI